MSLMLLISSTNLRSASWREGHRSAFLKLFDKYLRETEEETFLKSVPKGPLVNRAFQFDFTCFQSHVTI